MVMGGQCVVSCQGQVLKIEFVAYSTWPKVHCYFIIETTEGFITCSMSLTCWMLSMFYSGSGQSISWFVDSLSLSLL